jgi:spore coat protein JB
MDANQECLLKEVMAADFTVIELNLYLDTHPCDQRAIALYNSGVQRSKMLWDEYERMYGPLTARLSYRNYPWQWIESPWPWEKQG